MNDKKNNIIKSFILVGININIIKDETMPKGAEGYIATTKNRRYSARGGNPEWAKANLINRIENEL